MYSYYHRVEGSTFVSPTYMSGQTDINDKMRAILVDWLVEVHLKFKLMPETLFLTVNLIDRYLARHRSRCARRLLPLACAPMPAPSPTLRGSAPPSPARGGGASPPLAAPEPP